MKEENDQREQRCRKLGHPVSFSYCRSCGTDELPCRLIYDCWFESFDIDTFMKNNFTADERAKVQTPPQDKQVSILELIKKAQERKKG